MYVCLKGRHSTLESEERDRPHSCLERINARVCVTRCVCERACVCVSVCVCVLKRECALSVSGSRCHHFLNTSAANNAQSNSWKNCALARPRSRRSFSIERGEQTPDQAGFFLDCVEGMRKLFVSAGEVVGIPKRPHRTLPSPEIYATTMNTFF